MLHPFSAVLLAITIIGIPLALANVKFGTSRSGRSGAKSSRPKPSRRPRRVPNPNREPVEITTVPDSRGAQPPAARNSPV
jgi:hypothetical protein